MMPVDSILGFEVDGQGLSGEELIEDASIVDVLLSV